MPAQRVCAEPGCPTLTSARRCDDHQRQREQARGTRQQRGYDAAHDRERERWRPRVERGEVDCQASTCVMPERRIQPGQDWDLDHTDDRRGYRGPAHRPCNRGWRRGQ
ncbi:hypothetical protein ACIBJE_02140 [Micromonospora sp. NPDC050187]|uniref:hypothetical protein n=1 Tax=Micromonospora sp. NPDC050187 TaxID=3364277 RepID=UPI00379FF7BC